MDNRKMIINLITIGSRCPMNDIDGKKQNKRFLSTLNVYTNEKSHSVLGYVSPCEFEAAYYAN
jgi:hypothetical protein